MADRLTPPVRYPRYGEEPVRGNSTGKNRKTKEKSENSREFFHKSKIMDYWMHGGLDVPFFALVMVLLAIGLVMLLSASYPTAYFNGENSYSFFLKQACFAVVGVAVMLFVSKIFTSALYFRCNASLYSSFLPYKYSVICRGSI